MKYPALLLCVALMTACGTSATIRAYHDSLASFNSRVAAWNAGYADYERRVATLKLHPGRTIDAALTASFVRALTRQSAGPLDGAAIRRAEAVVSEEFAPRRASLTADEIAYAEGMQALVWRLADLLDKRDDLERERPALVRQGQEAVAAEQSRARWLGVLSILAQVPPAPALPAAPTPAFMPPPTFCQTQATGGGFLNTVCR